MPSSEVAETGAAALLFAAIFLWGGRVHPLRIIVKDDRSIVSLGAGVAIAYVFVHVMPELHGARRAFVESTSMATRYEGMGLYFLSLVGFLVFYGLDFLRKQMRRRAESESAVDRGFMQTVGGFAAYVWLMSYLLVRNLEDTPVSILLYTLAIAVHFLGVDHALRQEHGDAYERSGRFLLAGMALFGWGVGQLFPMPRDVVALLVAFISGAIIMNGAIMELPSEKDGRFLPFMAGGVIYGLILLLLG
jgi:hypothetical protein